MRQCVKATLKFFLGGNVCTLKWQHKKNIYKSFINGWWSGSSTENYYWFSLSQFGREGKRGGRHFVGGPENIFFSRPDQTVVMAPGLNIGDVIRESRVKQQWQWGVPYHNGWALRVQSVRNGAESDERKPWGSRGGRDDLWGKLLESSEPRGQSDPDLTSCCDSHHGDPRYPACLQVQASGFMHTATRMTEETGGDGKSGRQRPRVVNMDQEG